MNPIDVSLLVPLEALLEEGTVTGAAKRVGLSTPAMSHALARIRERLGDPILVRSGRGMLLTPRALELRPKVQAAMREARGALAPVRPFSPGDLHQTFVIHASDYVLTVLGGVVDRILREEAPGVCLRFVPNTTEDVVALRDLGSDLAVGIYGELPQEMRTRKLLTDRFAVVVRRRHPSVGARLTLRQYVSLKHIQVAPRGTPGGYVDELLREKGLRREVARAVPYFVTALQLAAETDYVLTVSERIAQRFEASLGLRLLTPPVPMRPYALSLVWHPRVDGDAAQRFLRDVFVRAAAEVAGERHPGARTRLDVGDPTAGQPRRRPRRRK